MARILALLRARAARARSSRPRWVSATVNNGPLAFSSLPLTKAAPALASNAAFTKSCPSREPFSATKRSPGLSVRVSMESPLTENALVAWPNVAASASAEVHSAMPRVLPKPGPPSPLPRDQKKAAHRCRYTVRSHGLCQPAPAHRPPEAPRCRHGWLRRGRRFRARREPWPEFLGG